MSSNRIFFCPNCNKRGPLNGRDYCCGKFLRLPEKTKKKKEAPASSTTWTCGACTFDNYPSNTKCGICSLPKSDLPTQSEESGKGKEQKKKEAPASSTTWTCGTCTFDNYPSNTECGICSLPKSDIPTQSEEAGEGEEQKKKEALLVLKPEKCAVNIPGYKRFYVLRFSDGTYCSVSATMRGIPKRIEQISMFSPLCMVIALFVANIEYFAGEKIFSPHALLEKVGQRLNLRLGQMLDASNVSRLEDVLKVNIDIRYSQDRDNINPTRNKKWKTLNKIVIINNHYHIPGLGI
jgi:hypothetical protein